MESKVRDGLVGLVVNMSTHHEAAGLIPGTFTNFKYGLGLGPPSLVRTIE